MAQIAKIDTQMDVKSSAQRFYEIFRSKQYLFPKICPDLIKDVQVIEGDWESVGSIKLWSYVAGIHMSVIMYVCIYIYIYGGGFSGYIFRNY